MSAQAPSVSTAAKPMTDPNLFMVFINYLLQEWRADGLTGGSSAIFPRLALIYKISVEEVMTLRATFLQFATFFCTFAHIRDTTFHLPFADLRSPSRWRPPQSLSRP